MMDIEKTRQRDKKGMQRVQKSIVANITTEEKFFY